MIIEHLDSLKVWLVKKLEPICDADPSALAKYVIALAKKDKTEPDLRALCEDQLDVFLGDDTKPFVTELFDTLQTRAYVPVAVRGGSDITNALTDGENKGKKRKSFDEEDRQEIEKVQKTENRADVSKTKIVENDKENTEDSNSKETTEKCVDPPIDQTKMSESEMTNKTVEDKHLKNVRNGEQDRSMKSMSPVTRRHGHSSRRKSSRSPSRSSGNRQHSSRSSRRDRTRREHRDSSRERRSRRTKKKEKCRDYEEKGFCMLGEVCPHDHGYDPVEVDDRNLPQMLSLAGIPPTQNQSQLPSQPLQFIPNMVPGARPLIPQINPSLTINTGLTTVQVQRPRPIPSPAELPGTQVPIFRPRNPAAFLQNISPTGVSQPIISTASVTNASTVETTKTPKLSASGEPYNPEEPSIEQEESDTIKKDENSSTENKGDTNMEEQDNRTQDELVRLAMGNVPLNPIIVSKPGNAFQMNGITSQQPLQTIPTQTSFPATIQPNFMQQTYLPMAINQHQQAYQLQLQLQQQQQQQQQAAMMATHGVQHQPAVVPVQSNRPFNRKNTLLEIRKIPKELNNIVKLSEHFQKFGNITKLQTPYDQDVQAALIEFSTYQEANAAYSSPEAILGNRFIKMFWHNPNRNQRNTGNNQQGNNSSTPNQSKISPTEEDNKPRKIATSAELKYRNPNVVDPKQLQIEKKKELENLKVELMKKKQNHYEELVKKQKDIFAKLQEGKNLSKDEKARLMKAFKHCDATVLKLKKELVEDAQAKSQIATSMGSKPYKDAKKEILDKEIDIYHGNLEGEELLEAKRELEQLKREAYGVSYRGRGFRARGRAPWHRGRGRGRGYARGGGFQSSSVDNRPKQILVTGFDIPEKDDVLAHFANFGPLDRIEETETEKMVLTFPTRKSAEIAAIQGADFNGKQLTLTWFTGQTMSSHSNDNQKIQRRMTRSLSQSLMEKDMDDELLELDKDEEEMLLAGVDDDDDDDMVESEERAWRR